MAAIAARPGGRVLNLATGTGTSSLPSLEAGTHVFPTDLSMGTFRVGKQQQSRLSFVHGDALILPFADLVFDVVTISYDLHNVGDIVAALREMLRVARPGGRLVIAKFSTLMNRALRLAYTQDALQVLPVIARVSNNPVAHGYLAELILAWPAQKELADLIADYG